MNEPEYLLHSQHMFEAEDDIFFNLSGATLQHYRSLITFSLVAAFAEPFLILLWRLSHWLSDKFISRSFPHLFLYLATPCFASTSMV